MSPRALKSSGWSGFKKGFMAKFSNISGANNMKKQLDLSLAMSKSLNKRGLSQEWLYYCAKFGYGM